MGKTRILYAEDDVVNRKLLKIKLEQFENVVCDLVEDGVTALEMLKKINMTWFFWINICRIWMAWKLRNVFVNYLTIYRWSPLPVMMGFQKRAF